MATVSAPRRLRPGSAPPVPVRHGKCSLHLSIGGVFYRLRPLTPPAGIKAVWSLHKQGDGAPAVYQVAQARGEQPACTCPDFTINGAVCKHVGALRALGLVAGRKARPAAARRSHARRLAEAPAGSPSPAAGSVDSSPVPAPTVRPAAPGSFAEGWHSAVAAHLRRRAGQVEPEPVFPSCEACGAEFDPAVSRDPHFCGPCAEEGAYK